MGYTNVTITEDNKLSPEDAGTVGVSVNGTITNSKSATTMVNLLDAPYSAYQTFYGFWYIPTGTHAVTDIFVANPETDSYPPESLVGCYVHLASTNATELPIVAAYGPCGEPTAPTLEATLSREPVRLSWGAGSDGTGNSVTGYDVQRCVSADGSSWGSWEDVPGSPVTGTEMSVSPPDTAGSSYKYRVRTRGSAGSNYYSAWVTGETALRRDHDALAGFTDDPLVAGETPVKALHITELQDRIQTLRAFYGLGAAGFTAVAPGESGLAGWTSHVGEIRAAVDAVCQATGKTHEAWLAIPVNCPRADVITQLRAVVLAL